MLSLLVFAAKASAQNQYLPPSRQAKEFSRLTAEADVSFAIPENFKEIPAQQGAELGLDYGITTPNHDIEIWFSVKSYRYLSRYYRSNPDSAYINLAKSQVNAFTADNDYFVRNLSSRILSLYKADEGKSYLINLNDDPETKHYRYALVIVLQKNHVGCITAVCFTNEKGPEFFKAIDKAKSCIKFKS